MSGDLTRQDLDDCLARANARSELLDLPNALASLDAIDTATDVWTFRGWILSTERALERVEVFVDGVHAADAIPVSRPDLLRFLPSVRHADRSGFVATIPRPPGPVSCVDLVGVAGARPLVRRRALVRRRRERPTPPPAMMRRVVGQDSAEYFEVGGFSCFGDFYEAIRAHLDPDGEVRMLDWGCGCGRIATHFLAIEGGPALIGCDIDDEAIRWCRENLRGESFVTVQPTPPLPFPDEAFDLVVSHSVLTHLGAAAQAAWLSELARVLRPGGVIAASVHGEVATSLLFPRRHEHVLRSGFYDARRHPLRARTLPATFRRSVFQSGGHTRDSFSRDFDMLDLRAAGAGIFQDLVVARRRA